MDRSRETSSHPNASPATKDAAEFRISPQPVIGNGDVESVGEMRDLPRSYGSDILCLLARDPKNLFAYWDIDWKTAFGATSPAERKVHLRILDSEESEMKLLEVEPMAGTCEVPVPNADSAYRGELGFFQPADVWNRIATSDVVNTPPDRLAENDQPDFATVPFHLAFQHMMDALRIAKHENESLTTMLADLRERADSPEASTTLTPAERELAHAIQSVEIPQPAGTPPQSNGWTQRKLEEILGFGFTGSSPQGADATAGGGAGISPQRGFGGSSRSR